MRLMKADLETVTVYRKVEKKSDYVGTVTELTELATVDCVVNPVTDKVSAELYGERIKGMVSLLTTALNVIEAGDTVKIGEVSYKVLSVNHYSDHDSITAERE